MQFNGSQIDITGTGLRLSFVITTISRTIMLFEGYRLNASSPSSFSAPTDVIAVLNKVQHSSDSLEFKN